MKKLTMRYLILTIICLVSNLSYAENEATFDMETGILNIPELTLFSDSYELDLQLKGQFFAVKDIKQNKIENTASGSYQYDQNANRINVSCTQSVFTENGPPVGSYSLPIINLTEKQLVIIDPSGDQATWNRVSGSSQTLIGSWQEESSSPSSRNIMLFKEDGSWSYTREDTPFMVQEKQINIDGNYSDWSEEDRVYLDNDGPECDDAPGRDLKEVYIAKDAIFIYLRFVLNEQLDNLFQYLFGDENLHMRVYKGNEGFKVSYSSGTGITGNSSIDLPDTFIHVDGNQFEVKLFNLEAWNNKPLQAWVDQGRETVCRDSASLPPLLMK